MSTNIIQKAYNLMLTYILQENLCKILISMMYVETKIYTIQIFHRIICNSPHLLKDGHGAKKIIIKNKQSFTMPMNGVVVGELPA